MNDFNNAYDAYQAAVKAVRKQGVKIAQGLRGDGCSCGCSGWKTPAAWGDRDTLTNYAFTRSGEVEWGMRSSNAKANWNWRGNENDDLSTGYALAFTFSSHGFDVDWDASTRDCVTVDIGSWDASKVGVTPERPDAKTFVSEVLTVGAALLTCTKAYEDAQARTESEDFLSAIQDEFWDLSYRANRLKESAWLVEWSDSHDVELRRCAISLSGRMSNEDRVEAVAYLNAHTATA